MQTQQNTNTRPLPQINPWVRWAARGAILIFLVSLLVWVVWRWSVPTWVSIVGVVYVVVVIVVHSRKLPQQAATTTIPQEGVPGESVRVQLSWTRGQREGSLVSHEGNQRAALQIIGLERRAEAEGGGWRCEVVQSGVSRVRIIGPGGVEMYVGVGKHLMIKQGGDKYRINLSKRRVGLSTRHIRVRATLKNGVRQITVRIQEGIRSAIVHVEGDQHVRLEARAEGCRASLVIEGEEGGWVSAESLPTSGTTSGTGEGGRWQRFNLWLDQVVFLPIGRRWAGKLLRVFVGLWVVEGALMLLNLLTLGEVSRLDPPLWAIFEANGEWIFPTTIALATTGLLMRDARWLTMDPRSRGEHRKYVEKEVRREGWVVNTMQAWFWTLLDLGGGYIIAGLLAEVYMLGGVGGDYSAFILLLIQALIGGPTYTIRFRLSARAAEARSEGQRRADREAFLRELSPEARNALVRWARRVLYIGVAPIALWGCLIVPVLYGVGLLLGVGSSHPLLNLPFERSISSPALATAMKIVAPVTMGVFFSWRSIRASHIVQVGVPVSVPEKIFLLKSAVSKTALSTILTTVFGIFANAVQQGSHGSLALFLLVRESFGATVGNYMVPALALLERRRPAPPLLVAWKKVKLAVKDILLRGWIIQSTTPAPQQPTATLPDARAASQPQAAYPPAQPPTAPTPAPAMLYRGKMYRLDLTFAQNAPAQPAHAQSTAPTQPDLAAAQALAAYPPVQPPPPAAPPAQVAGQKRRRRGRRRGGSRKQQ
jgi:hypothetical protein